MPFTHILDPFEIAHTTGLTDADYAVLVGVLDSGERGSRFKRVGAKGKIYSARFNVKGRVVFAAHGDHHLVLLAVFPHGQHDQYEKFLAKANDDYKKWITSGARSKNTIELRGGASSAAAAASSSATSGAIEIEELTSYGAQLLCLSDEQNHAIHVTLPALIQGPAGAGKTVVAFQILQQLTEARGEAQSPVLYLGPPQLVRELAQLWAALELSVEEHAAVQFKTVESLAQDCLPLGLRFSAEAFECWYKETFREIMSNALVWPALMGKSNCKQNVEQEKPAKLMHREFKLIAQFVAINEADAIGWEANYRASPMSHFLNPELLKEHFMVFFKKYNAYLESHSQIDLNIFCRRLRALSRDDYSVMIIDEAQLLPIAMTKWLADSRIPIAFLCDPHQATSDATLGFLRLSHQLFRGIPTVNLTGSYRVPPHIARCADRILQKKMQLIRGQSMSGAAAEFFSHRKGDVGALHWRENDPALIAELTHASKATDTAFIIFTPEDREYVATSYGAVLVFTPEEIQGLEYCSIVIVNPESCLTPVFLLEKGASADTRKDRHRVFQCADEVVALNQLFVAVTRAKAKVTMVGLSSAKRYTDDIKRLLGLEAGVIGNALSQPVLAAQPTDWEAEMNKLILSEKYRQAQNIWMQRLKRDPVKFDAYYHSILSPSRDAVAPIAAAAAAPRLSQGMAAMPAVVESAEVRSLRAAAKRGDAAAQLKLGMRYERGIDISKDEHEAVRWYRTAAEQGYADAQFALGCCCENSVGIAKDEREAVRWYRLAAEQKHAGAQYNLGKCYENGTGGVVKNQKEAVRLYRLAAQQGLPYAQYKLGKCYQDGKGVAKDASKAVDLYRLAAQQKHPSAQADLGVCYEHGVGITKNISEAVRYYSLAAEQGIAEAQFNLGICYEEGRGIKQDYGKAVHWYSLAAEQGNVHAQYNLGLCYRYGKGVPNDEHAAIGLFRAAAAQGEADAQYHLVSLLAIESEEVRLAAKQGSAKAQHNLACSYRENGEQAKAVHWYRLAADQGHAGAQNNLANCYRYAIGIAKDERQAVRYYRLAAQQGVVEAGAALNDLLMMFPHLK